MSEEKMYNIEKTSQEKGYTQEQLNLEDTLKTLNNELENGRIIFIDGKPFDGTVIFAENLDKYKKSICVTNLLVGG